MKLVDLKTPFEEDLDPAAPWQDYPRPTLVRDSYINLNGEWLFSKRKTGDDHPTVLGNITVPFAPESRLSGMDMTLKKGERLGYVKRFTKPELKEGERLILHFGAVDQIAYLSVNAVPIYCHIGGYLPFGVDITDYLHEGENSILLEALDDLDLDIPYGKQRKKRGGMWYTPISGIWQTVWMEVVPENEIEELKVTATLDSVTLTVVGGDADKKLTLHTEEGDKVYTFTGDTVTLPIEDPKHWTPETPYLYRYTLESGKDKVRSYFALRTVRVEKVGENSYIFLNGKPYFFHGLLDQGYFSDGIYLPATAEGYKNDILTMKSLGFNMLRKHIKVEPEIFYYYCDLYGMAVFQDMVNSGKYSFLRDTALPTLGIKKGIRQKASDYRKEIFEDICRETLDQLHNHPSVVYYTVFNEGWGQYDADRLYTELKTYDPTRIYDATSGWFFEKESDVDSHHIYFKKLSLTASPDRPLVLSEFGGYSYKVAGHSANEKKTYGYRFFKEKAPFEDALDSLYRDEVIPLVAKGLAATVYTQVSDVEDETNGLFTYDRQVLKVDKERMKLTSNAIFTAFQEKTGQNEA